MTDFPKEARLAWGAHQALCRLGFRPENIFTYVAPKYRGYTDDIVMNNVVCIELKEGSRNFVMGVCRSTISGEDYQAAMLSLQAAKSSGGIAVDEMSAMVSEYWDFMNENGLSKLDLIISLQHKGFVISRPCDQRAEKN